MSAGTVMADFLGRFGALDGNARMALSALPVRYESIARGRDILTPNTRSDSAIVLISGYAMRYGLAAAGDRQITSIHLPTEIALLDGLEPNPFKGFLGAVTDVNVGFISLSALHRLAVTHTKLGSLLWSHIQAQADTLREWMMRIGRLSAEQAMADFFCEFFSRSEALGLANGNHCPMPFTQTMLGDALGLTPVHISRTGRDLRRMGAANWTGRVLTITSWDRLCEIAQYESPPVRGAAVGQSRPSFDRVPPSGVASPA